MVLWFSGTGNSEYIAKRVANALSQETVSLFDRIKNDDYSSINTNEPLIIVVPTYAWRIPTVVSDYLKRIEITGNNKAYFLMTCGGDIGNAEHYLVDLCKAIKLEYMGVKAFVMPENYIAMFGAPEEAEAIEIVRKVEPIINSVVATIKAEEPIKSANISVADKLKSGIVNKVFYSIFVKDKQFFVTQSCVGCGKCVDLCPMNNIEMIDGKPAWKGNCTHCMSCICKCSSMAIEYGKQSLNQPRYTCPM